MKAPAGFRNISFEEVNRYLVRLDNMGLSENESFKHNKARAFSLGGRNNGPEYKSCRGLIIAQHNLRTVVKEYPMVFTRVWKDMFYLFIPDEGLNLLSSSNDGIFERIFDEQSPTAGIPTPVNTNTVVGEGFPTAEVATVTNVTVNESSYKF